MDKILALLVKEFAKYSSIEKAVLFGSRARGDNGERSDYDIAVFGQLSHSDKVKLRAMADDGLPTLHKIDLVFVNEIENSALLDNIQREGCVFMAKLNNKYDNFSNAVNRLNEANIAYRRNPENDIYQDALIKRFEFTFELAWKTLREFLIDQGYRLEIASPKNVIAFAYREGILSNEELWLDMLTARNNTAHDYGRELSAEIANDISNRYCKELTALKKLISDI